MRKFSKDIEKRLLFLSSKTDNIFTDEAAKIVKKGTRTKAENIKCNDENLKKIKSQLPNGIYRSVDELIKVINANMSKNEKSSITYSPIALDRQKLKACKKMSYTKGNVITGRDKEIQEILLALSKKDKRGAIIVGEPGTGKTAIVRAINAALVDRNVPRQLIGCELHVLDIPYIFTTFKEDPMGTIINILETVSKDDKHIVFIDEVHQLLNQKMNDVLKPYLTEKIRFIGSTTVDEYHSIITDDKALERRFTIINCEEPNIDATSDMIVNTKNVFQDYHNCSIPDASIKYLVENGSRFLGHRKNPDKSLDILDMACTLMNQTEIKNEITESKKNDDELLNIDNDLFEINSMTTIPGNRTLTKDHIDMGISSLTGIDYGKIRNSLNYDYVNKILKDTVFGQNEQLEELANVVNIMKHINFDQDKPMSTMLLVGNSGSGKHTAVKKLTELIFGSTNNLIDYDMGSFTSEFMITELKGAPPGYVGYAKSGKLIKEIRNKPQSIVYFRNINKCHPTVLDYLLTSIRKGSMVDSAEREVRLNNTIIIFSVSLSENESKDLGKKSAGIGFSTSTDKINKKDIKLLKNVVSADLIESVDSTIIFDELETKTLQKIYENNLQKYLTMYKKVDIDLGKLKKAVMEGVKTGHDVINNLSSQVPKLIFKTTKNDVKKEKKWKK